MKVGIESINLFAGKAKINIHDLFVHRGLDTNRISNILLEEKSVGLPCEDPVTMAVNAAKPLIEKLSKEDLDDIELLITATESGVDFGKSLSTYIHKHLNLGKRCRMFEIKQACYGGTAALQMAASMVAASLRPNAKALVIATDTARPQIIGSYAEPSQGAAAVAMIVGRDPVILDIDLGASGYCSYEVMDTYRPTADLESGDADLSLLSYLDCLEESFGNYCEHVEGVDLLTTFDYLIFHTPFPGMVKGAHRKLMRKFSDLNPTSIGEDFDRRVLLSTVECSKVGNIYSGTVFLALVSLLNNLKSLQREARIGIFSYGSGCSSEFYSGVVSPDSVAAIKNMNIKARLDDRYTLSMDQYDSMLNLSQEWRAGVKEGIIKTDGYQSIYDDQYSGQRLLVLSGVDNYYRMYGWS